MNDNVTSNDSTPSKLKSTTRTEEHFADLVAKLDRLWQKIDEDVGQLQFEERLKLADPIEACSKIIREIDSSAHEMRKRLGQVESHNHELRLQLKARASESQTDGLTGLANRRLFDREFGERCSAARQSCCPLVLVILDIDHFKSVNDSFGHHVGDAVLRGMAKLIKKCLPIGTFLARYGGEEFVTMVSGTSLDSAIEVVERVRRIVCETEFRYEGQKLGLTISCGLAQLESQEHGDHLLQRADSAMYAAKQTGRNRTFWNSGERLHCATNDEPQCLKDSFSDIPGSTPHVVELNTGKSSTVVTQDDLQFQSASTLNLKTTRANWCDGTMLFWNIRQRLAEWKGGGDPFCVLAIEVDDSAQLAISYGPVALHFMMRVQLLHLDSNLRDMDIVARTGSTRIIVVLPRSQFASIAPLLKRLRESMHRYAFPTATELVEYSISIGATEATLDDDAHKIVQRAEQALAIAQAHGNSKFFAGDSQQSWQIGPISV